MSFGRVLARGTMAARLWLGVGLVGLLYVVGALAVDFSLYDAFPATPLVSHEVIPPAGAHDCYQRVAHCLACCTGRAGKGTVQFTVARM